MKNYPVFIDQKIGLKPSYYAWTNAYLKEINTRVLSLFDYSTYFIPDYIENNEITMSSSDSSDESFDVTQLSLHEYFQLEGTEDIKVYVPNTGQYITAAPGSMVISNARAEGQLDTSTAEIRNDLQYYFIQPSGWGAFYIPLYGVNKHSYLQYDRYGEMTYGRELYWIPNVFASRYINLDPLPISNGTSGIPIIPRRNDKTWRICDKQSLPWLNASDPIFVNLFINNDTQEDITIYPDEIIADTVFHTSTLAKSNVVTYTIESREHRTTWPQGLKAYVV